MRTYLKVVWQILDDQLGARAFCSVRQGAVDDCWLLHQTGAVERVQIDVSADPSITQKLMNAVARQQPLPATRITDKLTAREVDVLRVLSRGLNNAAIARVLHLSEGTVRNYISAILAKLDLSDRTQAAVLAIKHGIR